MFEHSRPEARSMVIIGAGGHAVSVANVAISAGYLVQHFVDAHKVGTALIGATVIADLAAMTDLDGHVYAIAIGDNSVRERVHSELTAKYPALNFPTLIHASATVCSFTHLGEGTVVMPQAVIGPCTTVGRFCLVNTRASIDHDSEMKDFSSLAPAAVTGGHVAIGKRTAISLNASIHHGIKVGDDCVVGANSYVNRHLPDKQVAYGTPARLVRARRAGDTYL